MIKFQCQCGKPYKVKDDAAGKKAKCPACGQSIVVPELATQERTQLPVVRRSVAVPDPLDGLISAISSPGPSSKEEDALTQMAGDHATAFPSQPVDNELRCPMCSSTNLTTNNKGFSIGKAAVGYALLGPLGTLGGLHKANKVKITCLKCGHEWIPGHWGV